MQLLASAPQVAEAFFWARRLCIYPQRPLYDSSTRSLTSACKFALRRVFRICTPGVSIFCCLL
jgi:hypothetical protein